MFVPNKKTGVVYASGKNDNDCIDRAVSSIIKDLVRRISHFRQVEKTKGGE